MTAPGGPVYQGVDPYHSLGPDVSKKSTSSISNKQVPPQSVVNEPTPVVYEVPDTHNFTVRYYYSQNTTTQISLHFRAAITTNLHKHGMFVMLSARYHDPPTVRTSSMYMESPPPPPPQSHITTAHNSQLPETKALQT